MFQVSLNILLVHFTFHDIKNKQLIENVAQYTKFIINEHILDVFVPD